MYPAGLDFSASTYLAFRGKSSKIYTYLTVRLTISDTNVTIFTQEHLSLHWRNCKMIKQRIYPKLVSKYGSWASGLDEWSESRPSVNF